MCAYHPKVLCCNVARPAFAGTDSIYGAGTAQPVCRPTASILQLRSGCSL